MEGRTIQGRDDGKRRAEEGHTWLKVQAAFFNVDNVLVASANTGWIQTVSDTLTWIFNRVCPSSARLCPSSLPGLSVPPLDVLPCRNLCCLLPLYPLLVTTSGGPPRPPPH